jgi:hypothetical protein
MKFKQKKPGVKYLRLVAPGDVLVCARATKQIPESDLAAASAAFMRLGLIENARLLAADDNSHYLLVLNVQSEDAASRIREKCSNDPIAGLDLCDASPNLASRIRPFGRLLPSPVANAVTMLLSADPVVIENHVQRTAERMDRDRGGDYIFPDLPDELYREVKERRKRKTN